MEQLKVFDERLQTLIEDGVFALSFEKGETAEAPAKPEQWSTSNPNSLTCSYCRVEFADPSQHREHYKLDWHRYNLKQSLLLRPPVTEQQFNDQTDDVSSISGSESECEDTLDTLVTAQGRIFLKNNDGRVFGMYRCLFANKKIEIDDVLPIGCLREYYRNNQWTVLMLGGGHFAGAIFQDSKPVLHKTFHCYTVRAGQGSSQSSRDNQSAGSHPKSAGASLRRYNEMSLVQHVKDIVEDWREEISKSSLIFVRAAGPFNKSLLFGGKNSILTKTDPRVRTVPFSTRRATFAEVKRIHDLLSTVFIYDSVEIAAKGFTNQKSPDREVKRSKTKTTNVNRARSREFVERPLPARADSNSDNENYNNPIKKNSPKKKDVKSDDEADKSPAEWVTNDVEISFDCLRDFGDSLSLEERRQKKKKKPKKSKAQKLREQEEQRKNDMFDIISRGDVDKLTNVLKTYRIDDDEDDENKKRVEEAINESIAENGNTLLHVAALHEQTKMVVFLLDNDASPCLRNSAQQTPYTCTPSKEMRELFKQFAKENPDKYNYNKAQIPISTTDPDELAEKKKLQRKIKREKEKEKKKEIEVRKQEQVEKDRFLQLSDREKRALAAERRILSQSGVVISRCFLCAGDISGKVPFEYLGNRFCSVDCLKAHRMKHPTVLST